MATISSTARTDSPSATIRWARRPRVTRAQHPGGDPALYRSRQLEQPYGVRNVRPRSAHLLGQFVVRSIKVIEQLLVRGGLFQRVQLLPVKVFHERFTEQIIIPGVTHDGGNMLQPGLLARPPPPFAHDQLEMAGHHRAHDHRLEQAHLTDGGCKLLERILVKDRPGLARVRRDRADRHLLEICLPRSSRLRHQPHTCRRLPGTRAMACLPHRHRSGGDERPKPFAESPLLLSHLISSRCRLLPRSPSTSPSLPGALCSQ